MHFPAIPAVGRTLSSIYGENRIHLHYLASFS